MEVNSLHENSLMKPDFRPSCFVALSVKSYILLCGFVALLIRARRALVIKVTWFDIMWCPKSRGLIVVLFVANPKFFRSVVVITSA